MACRVTVGLANMDSDSNESLAPKRSDFKNVLKRFIRAYRDLPLLWDVNSEDYMNKEKKNAAYDQLLAIYREIMRDAVQEDVKKKINSLRTNYRKELRKVNASKLSTNSGDEVYKPSCWTFKELSFLGSPQKPSRSLGLAPAYLVKTEFGDEEDMNETRSTNSIFSALAFEPTPKRNKPTHTPQQNAACSYLSKGDSGEDIIARGWALKLKRMDREQRIYAEKFINEILLEGELGTLHRHSVKVNESSPIFASSLTSS